MTPEQFNERLKALIDEYCLSKGDTKAPKRFLAGIFTFEDDKNVHAPVRGIVVVEPHFVDGEFSTAVPLRKTLGMILGDGETPTEPEAPAKPRVTIN